MSGRRGFLPRAGIALLNLLGPGLGLLRLGDWPLAIATIVCSFSALLFIRVGPSLPFPAWLAAMILVIGALLFSIGFSWRFSAIKSVPIPKSGRWPVLALAAAAMIGSSSVLTDPDRIAYRNFYSPSNGMAPTLPKGDRFVAYMRSPATIMRGDVVLVRAQDDDIYVKRVAGLPGDRIEMIDGVVLLNGQPSVRQLAATMSVKEGPERLASRRFHERFLGEPKSHQILDIGRSSGDDLAREIVRPGHYFLLGDNRDRSADSRFEQRQSGLGQVGAQDILGKVLFHSWGSSKQMGTTVH